MGRAPCCEKNGLKKGPWTPEEDRLLIEYIHKNGYGHWRSLPKKAGLQRCGKSCRLRWTNYLRPDIKRGKFSFEEEETIIQLHSILGNKWSAIAARLPGRTDNEIKNYWNTHIRKRLLRMGLDPVTHLFRLDLPNVSTILNSFIHNNSTSHMRFSRLSRMQPFINPEVSRLASSLLSSRRQNHDSLIQNDVQIPPSLIQTCQNQNPFQDLSPTTNLNTAPCVSVPAHDQAHQTMQYDDVMSFWQNLSVFGSLSGRVNGWEQNNESMLSFPTEDYSLPVTNYSYYGSDQPVLDPIPSSETCTFQSNSSNSFSFQPVLSNISTPLSSSTPLQFEFDLQC